MYLYKISESGGPAEHNSVKNEKNRKWAQAAMCITQGNNFVIKSFIPDDIPGASCCPLKGVLRELYGHGGLCIRKEGCTPGI